MIYKPSTELLRQRAETYNNAVRLMEYKAKLYAHKQKVKNHVN